ncbi:MAG TPA: DUF2087 domain-containing protein [Casimicrobiaceae bacterium]|nr:DUF2087 domain-containing protein [Casimicrobiaceae bacterium]
MSEDPYVAAWREVAVKRGVGLGALSGSRGGAFAATMAAASLSLPTERTATEREVNERLVAWLAGPGAMLATDHVELRRWLVDLGLVERDGFGRAYRRVAPPPALAAAVEALARVDPAAIAAQARDDDARRRAERRARHDAGAGRA